jgi:hypothetical protein
MNRDEFLLALRTADGAPEDEPFSRSAQRIADYDEDRRVLIKAQRDEIDRLKLELSEQREISDWFGSLVKRANIGTMEIPSLRAYVEKLEAELAHLQEWKQIILGTGTDQEAVIRMAATEYTTIAVEAWRREVATRDAEIDRLKVAHMAEVERLKTELEQAAQRVARLREGA